MLCCSERFSLGLQMQGKHREAAAVLEAAVDPLDPSPEPARLLALAYASLGRPEDGERVVRRALVHHPLVADVHASLAACLAIEGRDGEALQS